MRTGAPSKGEGYNKPFEKKAPAPKNDAASKKAVASEGDRNASVVNERPSETKFGSDAQSIKSKNNNEVAKAQYPLEDMNQPMAKSNNESGDHSRAVLEKLTEKQRRVFDELPLDRAVTVDYLSKAGIPFGEVISALTVLEIKGLVASLPGALYIRK